MTNFADRTIRTENDPDRLRDLNSAPTWMGLVADEQPDVYLAERPQTGCGGRLRMRSRLCRLDGSRTDTPNSCEEWFLQGSHASW